MVLTVTLNPALDRIMFIPSFVSGQANRIYRRENCIGGKGAHVSWNLADLGMESFATGIALGPTGQLFVDALSGHGVKCGFYRPEGSGDTRTNYIIVEDSGVCSLVCEKGPEVTPQMLSAYLEQFRTLAKDAEVIVISGDASNYETSFGSSFQKALLEAGNAAGAKMVLDANGMSLREGVACRPYLIKPNAQELFQLTGMPANTEAEILAAIRSLDRYDLPVVAVSLGNRGSLVRIGERYYRVGCATATCRNEVGCGDAYLAGLVYGLVKGVAPRDWLAFASACGGAQVENPLTVGLDAKRAWALRDTVSVEALVN